MNNLLKNTLCAIALFIGAQVFAQSPTPAEAVKYSDNIIHLHQHCLDATLNYTIESIHTDDPNEKEKLRDDIITLLNSSLEKLKKMEGFHGDTKLRDEGIEVFELYLESFSIDFPQVQALENSKEDSYEAMEKYMEANDKVEDKINKTAKRFQKAHQAYADKYNIKLIESDEKDDRVEIIGETNKYNRAIFLQFFRVSKANSAFNEALVAQKASSMESKRKLLMNEANAALVAIKNVKPLNGDKTYRNAAIEFIEYHRNLAKNEFSELVNIIKKGNGRTQEDVNRYNLVCQEYNNQNVKLVNDFNNASVELYRTNIPKSMAKD